MNGINKVILAGHLGVSPVLLTTAKGKQYTRLSIATHRILRTQAGRESRTQWHSVTVWGKLSETCSRYLQKGAPVLVEGFLDPYQVSDNEGKRQFRSAITAEKVDFLPGLKSQPRAENEDQVLEGREGEGGELETDEELPF